MEQSSPQHETSPSSAATVPTVSLQDQADLLALDAKINALLPPTYQNCYDDVSPSSMGSTGLKFGPDGRVAWDEMWTSFCDLALAGGPAHRGTLLGAIPAEEALAEPEKYQAVVEEIGRGLWLVTELPVLPKIAPGWVGLCCDSEAMAVWLLRALVVENVMGRRVRDVLQVPAGPHFRLEKEIKNVVTAVAKTYHYWAYHMPPGQRDAVVALVGPTALAEAPAAPAEHRALVAASELAIRQATDLPTVPSAAPGWVGVKCVDEEMAVWLLRAVLVENVLVRRETAVLYLPASPETNTVATALAKAWRLWHAHLVLQGRGEQRKN